MPDLSTVLLEIVDEGRNHVDGRAHVGTLRLYSSSQLAGGVIEWMSHPGRLTVSSHLPGEGLILRMARVPRGR
jgi:hypothetical protein